MGPYHSLLFVVEDPGVEVHRVLGFLRPRCHFLPESKAPLRNTTFARLFTLVAAEEQSLKIPRSGGHVKHSVVWQWGVCCLIWRCKSGLVISNCRTTPRRRSVFAENLQCAVSTQEASSLILTI